jgi:oligoribonuclease (3'-5' exoribonuclease)
MASKRKPRHTFRDASGKRVRMHYDPITGEYVRYAHLVTTLDHKGNIPPMARKPKDPSLLIIDCSTSGVQPASHTVLEVAALLVDCRPPYAIIDSFMQVVHHAPGTLDKAPPFHGPLVEECYAANPDGGSIAHVEGNLLGGAWTTAGAVLNHDCGFTLKFLQAHMPTLTRALPRLQIDIDGVELLMCSRGVPRYVPTGGGRSFRAGDDVIYAYEQLLHFLSAEPAPVSGQVAK